MVSPDHFLEGMAAPDTDWRRMVQKNWKHRPIHTMNCSFKVDHVRAS